MKDREILELLSAARLPFSTIRSELADCSGRISIPLWKACERFLQGHVHIDDRNECFTLVKLAVRYQIITESYYMCKVLTALQRLPLSCTAQLEVLLLVTRCCPQLTNEACVIICSWIDSGIFCDDVLRTAETLIKDNFMYVSEKRLGELSSKICLLCLATETSRTIRLACLNYVATVVKALASFPLSCVSEVVIMLCILVNADGALSTVAWQTMRGLLSSRIDAVVFRHLLDLLREGLPPGTLAVLPFLSCDNVIRGAVFFCAMACWGAQCLPSSEVYIDDLLSALAACLQIPQPLAVALEIALAIRRLCSKSASRLQWEWSNCFSVISSLIKLAHGPFALTLTPIMKHTAQSLRVAWNAQLIYGAGEVLHEIVQSLAGLGSEDALAMQIELDSESCLPPMPQWQSSLSHLLASIKADAFGKRRNAAMHVLQSTAFLVKYVLPDAITEAALPFLKDSYMDPEPSVQLGCVRLATELCKQLTSCFPDLIVELSAASHDPKHEVQFEAVLHLRDLFTSLIRAPRGQYALKVFDALLPHASSSYLDIRKEVLPCVLAIRCCSNMHVVSGLRYSPNLVVSASGLSAGSLLSLIVKRLSSESSEHLWVQCAEALVDMLLNGYILSSTSLIGLASFMCASVETFGDCVEDRPKGDLRMFSSKILVALAGYATNLPGSMVTALVGVLCSSMKKSFSPSEISLCLQALCVVSCSVPGTIASVAVELVSSIVELISNIDLPFSDLACGQICVAALEALHSFRYILLQPVLSQCTLMALTGCTRAATAAYRWPMLQLRIGSLALVTMRSWFDVFSLQQRKMSFPSLIASIKTGFSSGGEEGRVLVDACLDSLECLTYMESSRCVESDVSALAEHTWVVGRGLFTLRTLAHGYVEVCIRRAAAEARWRVRVGEADVVALFDDWCMADDDTTDDTSLGSLGASFEGQVVHSYDDVDELVAYRGLLESPALIPLPAPRFNDGLIISESDCSISEIKTELHRLLRVLPNDATLIRALAVLDAMDTNDSAAVGICDIPANAQTEDDVLSVSEGSWDYIRLLTHAGTLTPLNGMRRGNGGLDSSAAQVDGRWISVWKAGTISVAFHAAPMMPMDSSGDVLTTTRKRHVANDIVTFAVCPCGSLKDVPTDSHADVAYNHMARGCCRAASSTCRSTALVQGLSTTAIVLLHNVGTEMTRATVSLRHDRISSSLPLVSTTVAPWMSVVTLSRLTALHLSLAVRASQRHLGSPCATVERSQQIERIIDRFMY